MSLSDKNSVLFDYSIANKPRLQDTYTGHILCHASLFWSELGNYYYYYFFNPRKNEGGKKLIIIIIIIIIKSYTKYIKT